EYAVLQSDRGELEVARASAEQGLKLMDALGKNDRNFALRHRFAGVIALQLRDLASAREHFVQSEKHVQDLRNDLLLWQTQVLSGDPAEIPPRLRALLQTPADQAGAVNAVVFVGAHCTLGWRELLARKAQDAIVQFEAATPRFGEVKTHSVFLTMWCMTGLGRALLATGELERAEEVLTRSLRLHRERQVRVTPSRAETLVTLAELHLRRGRATEAAAAAREADEFWQ